MGFGHFVVPFASGGMGIWIDEVVNSEYVYKSRVFQTGHAYIYIYVYVPPPIQAS